MQNIHICVTIIYTALIKTLCRCSTIDKQVKNAITKYLNMLFFIRNVVRYVFGKTLVQRNVAYKGLPTFTWSKISSTAF